MFSAIDTTPLLNSQGLKYWKRNKNRIKRVWNGHGFTVRTQKLGTRLLGNLAALNRWTATGRACWLLFIYNDRLEQEQQRVAVGPENVR